MHFVLMEVISVENVCLDGTNKGIYWTFILEPGRHPNT